jgi:hypothetical protein
MAPGRRCDVEVGVGVANVARLESRVGKFPSCPVRLHPNDYVSTPMSVTNAQHLEEEILVWICLLPFLLSSHRF